LSATRLCEEAGDRIRKFVFIGDYVDHGPSSKEVLDLIIGLKRDKVLICGNHEDMALRFIHQNVEFLKKYGNIWFDNGAMKTYESLYDASSFQETLQKLKNGHLSRRCYANLPLQPKYERFMKRLKYVHREFFEVEGRRIGFTFCHALPYWSQSLKEQRVRTYAQFEAYLAKSPSLNLDDTFIWGRAYSYVCGYQGDVVLHGHTPTPRYSSYYYDFKVAKGCFSQFKNYPTDEGWPFLFSRTPGADWVEDRLTAKDKAVLSPFWREAELRRFRRDPSGDPQGGVEAINVDTGAVYGGALTAVGLSPKYLARGLMPILSISTYDGSRKPLNLFKRLVRIDRFGGRRSRPNPENDLPAERD
jgi:hypothetical protein